MPATQVFTILDLKKQEQFTSNKGGKI